MPSKAEHLIKAKHNEHFYQSLTNPEYNDWSVNALFYAALHYVDAYLATKGYDPASHSKRLIIISVEHNLRPIYQDFQKLKDESEAGRYRMKVFKVEEVKDLELTYNKICQYIIGLI